MSNLEDHTKEQDRMTALVEAEGMAAMDAAADWPGRLKGLQADMDSMLRLVAVRDISIERHKRDIKDLTDACLAAERIRNDSVRQLRDMTVERNEARNKLAVAETTITLLLEALKPFVDGKGEVTSHDMWTAAAHVYKACSPEVQVKVGMTRGPGLRAVRHIEEQRRQMSNIGPVKFDDRMGHMFSFARDMQRQVSEMTGIPDDLMGEARPSGTGNDPLRFALAAVRSKLIELADQIAELTDE